MPSLNNSIAANTSHSVSPDANIPELYAESVSSTNSLGSPLREWSSADVSKWLKSNDLLSVATNFLQVDGPGFAELVSNYNQNSSMIMQYFKELGINFPDNLRLCAAIRLLWENMKKLY